MISIATAIPNTRRPNTAPGERPGASPGLLEAAEKADAANRLRPSAAKAGLIVKSITYGLKGRTLQKLEFFRSLFSPGEAGFHARSEALVTASELAFRSLLRGSRDYGQCH